MKVEVYAGHTEMGEEVVVVRTRSKGRPTTKIYGTNRVKPTEAYSATIDADKRGSR